MLLLDKNLLVVLVKGQLTITNDEDMQLYYEKNK